ncbi:MAG TPA: YqgE/AlgH family protein [Chitinophaga sp.]
MSSNLMPGTLLIADPFLKDPNFARTVVLLCEHQEEQGSFGFVINKLYDQSLSELVPDISLPNIPVYFGGPVQLDTIHFVHELPHLIEGSMQLLPGIHWGGRFDQVVTLINSGQADPRRIKFFIGYSGWSTGQLQHELKEKSWILSEGNARLIFREAEQDIWKVSLRSMGRDFAMMANFPIDPTLN